MKIDVPQEQKEQICKLYQQGYTRVAIKKQLNLPFGDSVIKKILEENEIKIKTNSGAQKGGRKKINVSREIQDSIIGLYQKGYGLDRIIKVLNLSFSSDKVKSILKDNNIYIRNLKEAYAAREPLELRKYPVNDNYILESHNGAWLMGLLAADGYLPITKGAKNRVTLTMQRRDEEILHLIADELKYKGPIYQFESTDGYEESSLSFSSKIIREKLENYGIVNNKTFKLNHLPDLPNEFMLDFIRGYFDGDGSIFERNNGTTLGMSFTCASKQFLIEIKNYLIGYGINDVAIHSTERVHVVYDIRYCKKDSLQLGTLFYNNDYLALPRKKQKFLELKAKYAY